MAQGLHDIIDLYSKFLLAFVGIVTPALALFLNNYLIDRKGFKTVIETQEKESENLIQKQFEDLKKDPNSDALKFIKDSNKDLGQANLKLEKWNEIYKKLNPLDFFRTNLILLSLSLLFLFVWLFIRTCKILPYDSSSFQPIQISACLLSLGFCVWHIINLLNIGFYLIRVRS
ncbi:MAG: hypothetical protein V4549_05815, partial [Bacteroidota bacterium]